MTTDDLLPLLKPSDWNLSAEMVSRPLADFPCDDMPFVTYGKDQPHTFEMRSRSQHGDATAESLDAVAIANLKKRTASWERVDIKLGWFKKLRLLVCGNDFLAAERILDTDFLRDAQDQLGAKMLAVGIPRRGMLMAVDGASSKANLQRFCAAVAGQYHRAESPPITATVFGVIDGSIVGHLEDGGIASHVTTRLADEPDTDEIYVQTMTFEAEGARRAVICAGGEPLDRVESRIRRELATLIGKYGSALRAEVAIIPDLTPSSSELDAWLPKLATNLSGLAGELGSAHPVNVAYGHPER